MSYVPQGSSLEEKARHNLARLRKERGLSQSEVGRHMSAQGFEGYNQMTVSRTEKGERPIRLDELDAYARLYAVSLTNLWRPEERAIAEECMDELESLDSQLLDASRRYLTVQKRLIVAAEEIIETSEESWAEVVAMHLADTPLDLARSAVLKDVDKPPSLQGVTVHESSNPEDLAKTHYFSYPPAQRSLHRLWEQSYQAHFRLPAAPRNRG